MSRTIPVLLGLLHAQEQALVEALEEFAGEHASSHGIHHVARDVARWSRDHHRRIAEVAEGRDISVTGADPALWTVGQDIKNQLDLPGWTLLLDLRALHLRSARISVDWELLAQAAQAGADHELLALASQSHPQTLRQMRWANAMIKEISPQVLAA